MAARGDQPPKVTPETIRLFLNGDLGCCGPQYLGQPFINEEDQSLDKTQRALLGLWTYQTTEGTHAHWRERGAISAEQRAEETAIKHKVRARAPSAKPPAQKGGKQSARGETPAPKGTGHNRPKSRPPPQRGATPAPVGAAPAASGHRPPSQWTDPFAIRQDQAAQIYLQGSIFLHS